MERITRLFTGATLALMCSLMLMSTVVLADDNSNPQLVQHSTWGAIKALYRSQLDGTAGSNPERPGAMPMSSSRFETRYCTWYAASEFDKIAPYPGCNWGGDAGTWVGNASAAGWKTYAYPTFYPHAAGYLGLPPGTIVVWKNSSYGHVAIVRSVFQNGIYIQEKNWPWGSGVSPWRLLYWPDVLNRSNFKFSGYIAPWRK